MWSSKMIQNSQILIWNVTVYFVFYCFTKLPATHISGTNFPIFMRFPAKCDIRSTWYNFEENSKWYVHILLDCITVYYLKLWNNNIKHKQIKPVYFFFPFSGICCWIQRALLQDGEPGQTGSISCPSRAIRAPSGTSATTITWYVAKETNTDGN